MYRVMQKYQKKLLAIFAVLLMIAFVATLGYRPGGGARAGDTVVAHLGKIPIYDSEMRSAKDDWQVLKRTPYIYNNRAFSFPDGYLPPSLIQEIDQHPEMLLLLSREATDAGVQVDEDRAREELATHAQYSDVSSTSPRMLEAVQAVRRLLLVHDGIVRFEDTVKVSQPAWRHALAQEYQQAHLKLVEFPADKYDKNQGPVTPEQLRQQFERYRNNPPGHTSPDNPLGFGYQIPTRVRLQYIQVPHDQVVAAVRGTGDKLYDWEVKAAEYYDANKAQFRNLEPATKPATQASTQPTDTTSQPATSQAAGSTSGPSAVAATQAAAVTQPASQPAIKPFAQVKEQIIERLAAADIEKVSTSIEKEVIDRLTQDWTEIRRADPAATRPAASQPSTAPASQPDIAASTQPAESQATSAASTQPVNPLMGLPELEKIRADVQQKYQVAIELHEIGGQWQTTADLQALPGIGDSYAPDRNPFWKYATSFAGGGGLNLPVPLQVWQPSPPLMDFRRNVYIFRLTAAEPPQPPASQEMVARQVESDWRTAQGYEQAKQAARKLLEIAKTAGLTQAAIPGGEMVLTANAGPFRTPNPFDPRSESFNDQIIGYEIKDAASRREFARTAQSLLADATPEDHHPATEVDLPGERKAIVMELAGENLIFPSEDQAEEQVVGRERFERIQTLMDDWFSYHAVVSRLGYTAEKT